MALRRTKQSAQGCLVEKALNLIPLTVGARAGTTFLHRATSAAREKGSAGPVQERRDSGTLYAIWPVGRRPDLRPSGEIGAQRFV